MNTTRVALRGGNAGRRGFSSNAMVMARHLRRLTQKELATKSGLSQGALSKWETDQLEPNDENLTMMARALELPESFFYQDMRVWPGSTQIHNRAMKSIKVRDKQWIDAEAIRRNQHIDKLRQLADFDTTLPDLPYEDFQGDPAHYARYVRSFYGVAPGPVPSVTKLIERAGVAVVEFDFELDKCDGMYFSGFDTPAVVVNERMPTDRRRFSIMHEFGHLNMHAFVLPEHELEASAFASEFLMPEAEIKEELRSLKPNDLLQLKLRWGVSMQALARRARDLKCITPTKYTSFCKMFSFRGWRKKEPGDVPFTEKPRLLREVIKYCKQSLEYTEEELSQVLDIQATEFEHLYGEAQPAPPKLKLVF